MKKLFFATALAFTCVQMNAGDDEAVTIAQAKKNFVSKATFHDLLEECAKKSDVETYVNDEFDKRFAGYVTKKELDARLNPAPQAASVTGWRAYCPSVPSRHTVLSFTGKVVVTAAAVKALEKVAQAVSDRLS